MFSMYHISRNYIDNSYSKYIYIGLLYADITSNFSVSKYLATGKNRRNTFYLRQFYLKKKKMKKINMIAKNRREAHSLFYINI